jgi:hypothetical protein
VSCGAASFGRWLPEEEKEAATALRFFAQSERQDKIFPTKKWGGKDVRRKSKKLSLNRK